MRGLDDFRMIGQPEIIIRAQHDDFADAVEFDGRAHRADHVLQMLVLPRVAKVREQLLRAPGEGCVWHVRDYFCGTLRTTLIASPLCISLKPFSKSSSGS